MANSTQNANYQWSQADLQDPTLYRINTTLTSINSRLTTLVSAQTTATAASAAPSGGAPSGGAATSIVCLHKNRSQFAAADYNIGSFLTESDRGYIYEVQYVSNVKQWKWVAGEFYCAQAGIPADLGVNDAGAIADIYDYGHRLRWSGTSWGWAPGDNGSGYFQDFAVAPSGAGWQACNGAINVSYLKSDGTLGVLAAVPNSVTTASYRKSAAAYASAITAATAPTISGFTNTGVAQITDTPATINNPVVGTPVNVAEHNTEEDSGHVHPIASVNAPISLAGGDPVAFYEGIAYFRQ